MGEEHGREVWPFISNSRRSQGEVVVLQQHDGVLFDLVDNRVGKHLVVPAESGPRFVPLGIDDRVTGPVVKVVHQIPEGLVGNDAVRPVEVVWVDGKGAHMKPVSFDHAVGGSAAVALGERCGDPLRVGSMYQRSQT